MPVDPDHTATTIGERLAAFYRNVAPCMRDLPVYNPRLGVDAVGFRLHDGAALGVMVTPWFMNIVLAAVPDGPALPDARIGDARDAAFPAGTVAFTVGELAGFGRLDTASLFSPMETFDDPAVARETAAAALVALLDPNRSAVAADTAPAVPRDRRALLFGRTGAA